MTEKAESPGQTRGLSACHISQMLSPAGNLRSIFDEAELFSLSVGTENVDDLVRIELLHLVTCRSEVLARVELTRLVSEYLADSGCHCKTGVRVDVDLADC